MEGGNTWNDSGDTTGWSGSVDGDHGVIEITSDGTNAVYHASSDSVDFANGEPWGPWVDDATWTIRWKVNLLGDTSDTESNSIQITIISGEIRATMYILLGDNAVYTFPSPYASGSRGWALVNNATLDDVFTSVSFAADTYYLSKMQVSNGIFRGKVWAASAAEPVAWQAEMPLTDYQTNELDRFLVSFEGNTTNGNMKLLVDWIKAELAAAGGGSTFEDLPPGDGTTTTWYISEWAPGTLRVWVDGIQTIPASTDREAGTFTFDRAPADGAHIRVEYSVP